MREGSRGAETLSRSWSCEDLGCEKDFQAEGTAQAKTWKRGEAWLSEGSMRKAE